RGHLAAAAHLALPARPGQCPAPEREPLARCPGRARRVRHLDRGASRDRLLRSPSPDTDSTRVGARMKPIAESARLGATVSETVGAHINSFGQGYRSRNLTGVVC